MPPERRGLGRGLGALIPAGTPVPAAADTSEAGALTVPLDDIAPNPRQPRQAMDEGQLEELAASIREHGLIQPLVVAPLPGEQADGQPRYQLIAGERRWHAARRAGLARVPVVIKSVTPRELLELALVENIQRADLNPLEEAAAYQQLIQEFGLTQEEVATRVGRSRVTIANAIRLLRLPEEIKDALRQGLISEGHARAILGLDDPSDQLAVLRAVKKRALSVRQTEELVRHLASAREAEPPRRPPSPQTRALEDAFRSALGTKVALSKGERGGRLVIYFYSDEELQSIYERIVGDHQ
ncbi:MAG: ParB/RepB/Spo0J family partition protein [Anaerolineae bacterium]|nr:ParB/RepB/Spo0J family partition protein [Anaerolineae bacterium]